MDETDTRLARVFGTAAADDAADATFGIEPVTRNAAYRADPEDTF